MDRRTFLTSVGFAGAAAVSGGGLVHRLPAAASTDWASSDQPNILFIMVDQLRYPQWFPNQSAMDTLLPSLARLRSQSVSFANHFTASNACTAARSTLLTGLYTHQTGCMVTSNSKDWARLSTGFPTWGTMLRQLGYQTFWYGKWHLSHSCDLDPYGFSGGTCPSPDGNAGQGLYHDPLTVAQFVEWLNTSGSNGPWCTAVSFVNPHDISWYNRFSNLVPGEREQDAPHIFAALPPNFETPADLERKGKPRLQQVYQKIIPLLFGDLPYTGNGYDDLWLKMLDLYLLMQRFVDRQIGHVLDTLTARPDIAGRTIIIFTSDHGEYAGSHGLRGKMASAYDEAIRVPLYVMDPRGTFTKSTHVERTQLTSSVDIAPLLLTLATSGNKWRSQAQYEHLAARLDLTAILKDPHVRGRPYILYATDEGPIELPLSATQGSSASSSNNLNGAPFHVVAYRTAEAKLVMYSNWDRNTLNAKPQDQEFEYYDYRTKGGRLELANIAPHASRGMRTSQVYQQHYDDLVQRAVPRELHRQLPKALQAAQHTGLQNYFSYMSESVAPDRGGSGT